MTQLPASEYFLCIPPSAGQEAGKLYELEPSETFSPASFVLIPYQNPQVKDPAPEFFRVRRQTSFRLQTTGNAPDAPAITFRPVISRDAYLKQLAQIKQQIQDGNIYEINYCIRFEAGPCSIDPAAVFARLHRLSEAPYAMLLKKGDEYILSASPELFLKKEGDRLFTKPIKGTIRRGKDPEEDQALKKELQQHLKERTEHVMAVDVARNDLSVFAGKGSVQVEKLYAIETFRTVHQMVSTVSCVLRENTSFDTVIRATFPMASMTGAPKLRAMQLIDKYEAFERGYYSGTMGLVDGHGDYTLSVIIRSIFYNQRTGALSIAVGGAITYLSDPEQEYEECLLKASGLLKALGARIAD